MNLAGLPELTQMVGLDFEQAGFHGRGAAQPPQQTGQPQHQFPLHRRLRIIVGNDGRFERLVIFGILQRTDHGLGREPVADGIAAGTLLAFFGDRTGAFAGIATVGLDLPEGGH